MCSSDLEWPTQKGSGPCNTTNQCRKQPKRFTSEWLKWKHLCQEMFDNHHIRFLCQLTICSLKKTVLKFTTVLHRLIVGWGDMLLGYLSSGKRKQRRYLFKKHKVYSNIRQHKNTNRSWIPAYLLSQRLIACATTTSVVPSVPVFDSDSYPILIDNCCTACITNCIQDFCNDPQSTKSSISGIGGPIGITLQGTIKWTFSDDLSRAHTFCIHNSYFAPDTPHRLFSDRKSTRLNSSHVSQSRMPSSA